MEQSQPMERRLNVRLPRDLAEWLEHTAARTGSSKTKIVLEALEEAREGESDRRFLTLAGSVRGAPHLSRRRGFLRG